MHRSGWTQERNLSEISQFHGSSWKQAQLGTGQALLERVGNFKANLDLLIGSGFLFYSFPWSIFPTSGNWVGNEIHFWLGGMAVSIHLFIDLSEGTLVSFYWSTPLFVSILGEFGRGE